MQALIKCGGGVEPGDEASLAASLIFFGRVTLVEGLAKRL